ncbi:MAG: PKD domain-containing protein [Ignavibacterium sp.]|nr:PKD domain-containing protein [Ignavibacterium sp.]
MKFHITTLLIFFLFQISFSQNWPTIGGKNQRNGLSKIVGPDSISSPYWSVVSAPTQIGNSVFTYGDHFVTSRSVFNPYTSKIECRSLVDGSLKWEMMASSSSRMFAIGFSEDAVYAHDYLTDSLYALSPIDGSILWAIKETNVFGGNTGILFAENGDPILRGKRLDRRTGQTKWFYNYIVPVMPNAGYAAKDSTFYHYSGSISTPKKLFALDIRNGQLKYESQSLPGDADQEWPITIGIDGTIYLKRDGGKLYAFQDTGNQLVIKWEYTPSATEMPGWFANDKEGNLYIIDNDTVKLLDKNNGSLIKKSNIRIKSSFFPNISVDNDGKVYVNNNEAALGKMVCLSPDLQNVIWELNVPYITYCGPALAKEGILIVTGSGNNIRAYKTAKNSKPVADFRVSKRDILTGTSVSFFDQSSFNPTSWQWFFQGGTPSTSNLKNPTNIRYDQPGVYEVRLVVSNSLGSDTLIKKSYIYVDNPSFVNNDILTDEITLFQNFPNPFNPTTNISWSSKISGFTTLKIYDILGNEITTLVNEFKEAGYHTIEFNNSTQLPSGVYFYQLSIHNNEGSESNKFRKTMKMVIMK